MIHDAPTSPADRSRARRELLAFFALAFAITWGIGILILVFPHQLEAVVGPIGQLNQSWLYFVAVYAPSIAAVALSFAFGGLRGLKTLASGLVRPVRLVWVAVAVLLYPAGLVVWSLLAHATGHGVGGIDLRALLVGAPLLLVTTPAVLADPGGFGEETGWRGFAMPRLLLLLKPAPAGLLLGAVWAIWHIPAFFAQGLNQSGFSFGWFFVAVVSLAVVMSWIYVNANGNFLVAGIIPHLVLNLVFDAHVLTGGPAGIELGASPIRTEAIVLTAIALAVVAASGSSLRSRRRLVSPAAQS